MIPILILSILLSSPASQPIQISSVKVPKGKNILLNGKCLQDEWADSIAIKGPNNYQLLFKQNDNYVFICIKPQSTRIFITDLYIATSDQKIYTLHASAKLGERILKNDKWEEWRVNWNWWEVNGWWANTSEPTDFSKGLFLPNQAREYQIDRRQFAGNKWRVMFHIIEVKDTSSSESTSLLFPEKADNLKNATWIEVHL